MSGIDWNGAVRKQFILHPEKFGYMGQYARELLEVTEIADYMADILTVRLTTAVLCGSTVSAHPKVEMTVPARWWQHWKHHFDWWVSDKDELWKGRNRDGSLTTPPPWTIALWPLLVLWPKWLRKHPVKYTKMTAKINFEQRVLYPEVDAPAQAGRPVIYETMDMYPLWEPKTELWDTSLRQDPSRFLNQHEIMSQMQRDPKFQDQMSYSYSGGPNPYAVLQWLERNGVNVDQLVKRQ